MTNVVHSLVPVAVLLSFVHIGRIYASIPSQTCAIEIQWKAARGRTECLATRQNAGECTSGYNTAISSIPILCGGSGFGRKKRYTNSCVYSPSLQANICFTGSYIYKLGRASSEPCNTNTHGKQKCVDSETFITCVWDQWTIQSMCALGTTCQAYPGSNQHILCGHPG